MLIQFKNELLKGLPEPELSLLREKLEHVELTVGEALYEPHKLIDYLYFPEDSMISLISVTRDGLTVEVGVIGCEGLLGAGAIFERNTIPYRATVQAKGKAYRVRVKVILKIFANSLHLKEQMLSYFHAIHLQVSQSAICNKFHTVQERTAKWLLLSVDRSGKPTLCYTHEFLSMILGSRRTTVSRALKSLQSRGLIRTSRSSITVLDVKQLGRLACECYDIVHSKFQEFD